MGLGGISPWQLLILLAIVLAIFGTKKLRNIGGDLGSAMRDFRGAMNDKDDPDKDQANSDDEQRVVDHQESARADTGEAKTEQTTANDSGHNKS
jgi:sec-independent protein translocase protein TatA